MCVKCPAVEHARWRSHISSAQIIACRTYGVILALAAVCFAAGGAVLLYWAANGVPPELLKAMDVKTLDAEMLLGLKAIGGGMLFVAVVNVVFAVFAFLGHLWPLVANTIGWTLVLAPTLSRPDVTTVAVLATLLGLTAIAVAGRYSYPAPAQS